MIYIIDHQDSFTWNVVHQFSKFDKVYCSNYFNINKKKLDQSNTIVLSPGPGSPKDYPLTSKIYKKYKGRKKIIGICLGYQQILFNEKGKIVQQKNITTKNIIKSMMPGGSVIGCPKIRTLELLNKQESEDRNIFTGSFGYIKFNQDMKFNIIIRSILNYKNISEISAASGVVLDSSSKKEFNENFIKARSLLELYK